MAVHENVSAGSLILPDGTAIASGASADISGDALANAGVNGWIKAGALVAAKAQPKPDTKDK